MLIPNVRVHVWYLFGVLFSVSAGYLFGYSKGYRTPTVVRAVYEFETIQEKIVEVQKLDTRTVWKTVKKPDGTEITETKQEVVTLLLKETHYMETEIEQKSEEIRPPISQFSLGFGLDSRKQIYGEAGYRVFANVWLELQGSSNEISAGVRLDW